MRISFAAPRLYRTTANRIPRFGPSCQTGLCRSHVRSFFCALQVRVVLRSQRMFTDPGPWVKFWWKGDDIAANFTSGMLVALTALGSWRLQQWWSSRLTKDEALRKRRIKQQTLAVAYSGYLTEASLLCAAADKFINDTRFESVPIYRHEGFPKLITLANAFSKWLEATSLAAYRNNGKVWSEVKAQAHQEDLAKLASLHSQIEKLEIPDAETDEGFVW